MPRQFIGISAVTRQKQLEDVADMAREEKISVPIAMGFQVSHRLLQTQDPSFRQPHPRELFDLRYLADTLGLIPVVHYFTKDLSKAEHDLKVLKHLTGDSELLLQWNTIPASPDLLQQTRALGFRHIFKVPVSHLAQGGYSIWKGEQVHDATTGNLEHLLSLVHERKQHLDYVTVDPSHGTGKPLDLREESLAIRFGKSVLQDASLEHLGIIYGGGFGPNSFHQARILAGYFGERVSMDAEGALMRKDKKDDVLVFEEVDLGKARAYVRSIAKGLLSKKEQKRND